MSEKTRRIQLETEEDPRREGALPANDCPALLLSSTRGRPRIEVLPVGREPLALGRETHGFLENDTRCSRKHVEVSFFEQQWVVRDLESRNGSHVDGKRIALHKGNFRVLRVGSSVFVPVSDYRPYLSFVAAGTLEENGCVAGPLMREVFGAARRAASASSLLLHGETGTGKEWCAKTFASAAAPKGPFVAVNCSSIVRELADRLLFGAVRGAYTGAAVNTDGYVQAAQGGVLFLDEIAELELPVQAKLLRFVDAREVLSVGASTPKNVSVKLCAASHRDLRTAVREGLFREDLFYRLAEPSVVLPPLRDRIEEIPWLAALVLKELSIDVVALEALLLSPWKGNVRELLGVLRTARSKALERSATAIELRDLQLSEEPSKVLSVSAEDAEKSLTREDYEQAIEECDGNLAAAARKLGMHRTQLYRELERHGLRKKSS